MIKKTLKTTKKIIIGLFCFGLSLPAFAISIDIPPGKWQCMAVDKEAHNYAAFGKSMLAARLAAKKECRYRSAYKKTCQTAQSYCEQGPVSLIDNRCVVSDESGRMWNATGRTACRTAKQLCQQYQYLHGSTRSVCTIKHRMRNYDLNKKNKNKNKKDTILEQLIDTDS